MCLFHVLTVGKQIIGDLMFLFFFFSPSLLLPGALARPYTELTGRNVLRQMDAATNCSAQTPPLYFRRTAATRCLSFKGKKDNTCLMPQ